MPQNPYSRGEFTQALVLNALMHPFNVGLLAAVTVAAIVLGSTPLGVIGGLLYLGSAGRTFFDEKEADKVLERERAERRPIEKPRVAPGVFAPPIARLVQEARVREQKVAEAIRRSELPYEEVASEVDAFIAAMDSTAGRAQLLYEALSDTPPSEVDKRLAAVRQGAGVGGDGSRELQAALEVQLETMRRMERQLQRFYMEMERILVELDTVRGQVASMSASADRAAQDQLAEDVRGLRERMGAVAEGMAEAYETERAAP